MQHLYTHYMYMMLLYPYMHIEFDDCKILLQNIILCIATVTKNMTTVHINWDCKYM